MVRRWGSIQTRRNRDGTESIRIRYEFLAPDGGRTTKSETLQTTPGSSAPTILDAELLLKKRYQEIHSDQFVGKSRETVSEFMARWLEATASNRQASTYYSYKHTITGRIDPDIGSLPLQKVTPQIVLQWIDRLKEAGYKHSTVRHTLAVFATAMADAVRWRLIARSPCNRESIKVRFDIDQQIDVWMIPEVQRFMATARRHPFGNVYMFILETGMRGGETRALRWCDVDLAQGVVLVDRTVAFDRTGKTVIRSGTKSNKSRRLLIGQDVIRMLTKTMQLQQDRFRSQRIEWSDQALIFDRGDGGLIRQSALIKMLHEICDEAGVRQLTPHKLRHTGATLMLALGVSDRIAQERLGHTSGAMTRRYQHPSLDMQVSAVESLATVLRGSENSGS